MTRTLNDPHTVHLLLEKIKRTTPNTVRIMEVCGTHTHAVSRYSFRQTLEGHVDFISGPGCPVCVTSQSDIDRMIAFAQLPDTISTTFGDMMRVPGSKTSLSRVKATGADIRVVFSPLDSLTIAQENPGKEVVFFGVGFETTTPVVAASIRQAAKMEIPNFSVLSFHKTIPEALSVLFSMEHRINGLLLPGHVSAVLGTAPFIDIVDKFHMPAAVTGFTPVEILESVLHLAEMVISSSPSLINAYKRVVRPEGNALARAEMKEVFSPSDSDWRGLGRIPDSGLEIHPRYALWDAGEKFSPPFEKTAAASACRCGEVITGRLKPHECPLFSVTCTPRDPHGPCMVSGEGACAAYYQFDRHYLSEEVCSDEP